MLESGVIDLLGDQRPPGDRDRPSTDGGRERGQLNFATMTARDLPTAFALRRAARRRSLNWCGGKPGESEPRPRRNRGHAFVRLVLCHPHAEHAPASAGGGTVGGLVSTLHLVDLVGSTSSVLDDVVAGGSGRGRGRDAAWAAQDLLAVSRALAELAVRRDGKVVRLRTRLAPIGALARAPSVSACSPALASPAVLPIRPAARPPAHTYSDGLSQTGSPGSLAAAAAAAATTAGGGGVLPFLGPLLAGNSKTFLLACTADGPAALGESMGTLRLAARVRGVTSACMRLRPLRGRSGGHAALAALLGLRPPATALRAAELVELAGRRRAAGRRAVGGSDSGDDSDDSAAAAAGGGGVAAGRAKKHVSFDDPMGGGAGAGTGGGCGDSAESDDDDDDDDDEEEEAVVDGGEDGDGGEGSEEAEDEEEEQEGGRGGEDVGDDDSDWAADDSLERFRREDADGDPVAERAAGSSIDSSSGDDGGGGQARGVSSAARAASGVSASTEATRHWLAEWSERKRQLVSEVAAAAAAAVTAAAAVAVSLPPPPEAVAQSVGSGAGAGAAITRLVNDGGVGDGGGGGGGDSLLLRELSALAALPTGGLGASDDGSLRPLRPGSSLSPPRRPPAAQLPAQALPPPPPPVVTSTRPADQPPSASASASARGTAGLSLLDIQGVRCELGGWPAGRLRGCRPGLL